MRITSGMVRRNYQKNLAAAQERMQEANLTNTNFKKFQKVSEDPAGASKAFQVRRELSRAETYEATAKDLQGRQETAEDSVLSIQKKLTSVYEKTLSAVNGTMGSDERKIYAEELRGLQKAILQDFNVSYSGQYLFGGAATGAAPLTVDENGKLLYRGQPVDGPAEDILPDDGTTGGEVVPPDVVVTEETPGEDADVPGGGVPGDVEETPEAKKLREYNELMQSMRDEKVLVDFGYGINTNNEQSGFNIAQPALDFLGFGTDEKTGLPNNLYSLIGEMADYLEEAGDNFSADEFGKFQTQFDGARNNFLTKMTNLGNKSETINYNLTRLSSNIASLKTKQSYIEAVDPAKSLSDFKYEEFAYNAALAIGTKILQPSLLDYLN